VAVGYTAPEIAILLEQQQYRNGKVYKIYRAYPEGRLEIKGVPTERFLQESGMVFWFDELPAARGALDQLKTLAERTTPPCRCKVHLASCSETPHRYCLAVIYPAEFEHEMGRWMLDIGFDAGVTVEGGPSVATGYYAAAKVLDRAQLWGAADKTCRTEQQVLQAVGMALQR